MAEGADGARGELDLRAITASLWRRRYIIVGVTALVFAGAYLASARKPSVFAAQANVLVRPTPSQTVLGNALESDRTRELRNEIRVIEGEKVRNLVEKELGFPAEISAAVDSDQSDVIVLRSTSGDRLLAPKVANTYAQIYLEYRVDRLLSNFEQAGSRLRARLETIDAEIAKVSAPLTAFDNRSRPTNDDAASAQRQAIVQQLSPELLPLQDARASVEGQLRQLDISSSLATTGGAELIEPASAPEKPVSPNPTRDGTIGLLFGLLLGVGLALLIEHLDESVRTASNVEAAVGIPVMAVIPEHRTGETGPDKIVSLSDPSSIAAEAYRSLRTSVRFAQLDSPAQCLQVTSSLSAEGKTTTVVNLAVAFARAGQRVIVLDCDLRRPRVHKSFSLNGSIGFTTFLLDEVALNDALQRPANTESLLVLVAGKVPSNPSEMLASKRFARLIIELRTQCDVLLIDTPPVLPVTDAMIVASIVDGVLIVATSGTSARALTRSVSTLRRVGAPLLGVVLNRADLEAGYGYGYRQEAELLGTESSRARRRAKRAAASALG